jgi:hypothetical protein
VIWGTESFERHFDLNVPTGTRSLLYAAKFDSKAGDVTADALLNILTLGRLTSL